MKHVLWMFSQPVDKDGMSRLTVADLVKLAADYDISENIADFPELSSLPEFAPLLVSACIYHDADKAFFELEFEYVVDSKQFELWKFGEQLPSEDAQWLLTILHEFYGMPPEPQYGAFGYQFTGEELYCEMEDGLHLIRHHGNDLVVNLRETVGELIQCLDVFIFAPVAFTIVVDPESNGNVCYLVMFFIEEHAFTRHLSPVVNVYALHLQHNGSYCLGKQLDSEVVITAIQSLLRNMTPEETLAVCGLIVE